MSFNRRRFLKTTAGAALAAPALMKSAMAGGHGAIKFVSILDQSGGLDIYGKPMVDATKMAIDEINEAGNNYDAFRDYRPYELKRSAGMGLPIFMPAFGLLGVDLGYGFDPLPNSTGARLTPSMPFGTSDP